MRRGLVNIVRGGLNKRQETEPLPQWPYVCGESNSPSDPASGLFQRVQVPHEYLVYLGVMLNTTHKPSTIQALVAAVKETDQDHEFYPTTAEIISAMVKDLKRLEEKHYLRLSSVLDIGAGNGKVLKALREQTDLHTLHAIEKSPILCESLDADILIVGTDFWEQSLFSKQVDVIFCNPPYSEYDLWAEKIIRQAAARLAYLVIPRRWSGSTCIIDALKFREADTKLIGSFDFEDAEDRRARAKVDLLRIEFKSSRNQHNRDEDDDAFERFFKVQFADLISKFEDPGTEEDKENDRTGRRKRPFHSLVVGPNYPEALVNLYNQEMAKIERNYQLVSELDADLLREFEILPSRVMAALKTRLNGLRHDYWHELFSHLDTITTRLTAKSRTNLLNVLHKHVQVDFTVTNIYAIVLWVIKNANRYLDSQLIDTYETMVDKANVYNYKSNHKTFVQDSWRYCSSRESNTHFALDYRIVVQSVGGCNSSGYSWVKGLEERAAEFLGDLLTVATNLGFQPYPSFDNRLAHVGRQDWHPGQLEEFTFFAKKNESNILFDVRGFKNGNLHIRFTQNFIMALNVEYGRLKGWLKSGAEAAEELKDPKAATYFQTNLKLTARDTQLLLCA